MLPALPVEATSARGADMAGARKGTLPAERLPAESLPAENPPAENPPADEGAGPGTAASKAPAAKGSTAKPGGSAAKRAPAKRGRPGGAADGASGDGRGDGQTSVAELPVREGEHQWTAAELAEVRTGLREQIETLRAEIAASASQIAEGDSSDGAGDDQADAGAKTYAREHELALAYNSQDLLAQIERAVQRMDAGTYGICESCTRPIGKARLQVFPRATLCVTCKQREERR
ncbi:TraR/DksA family transcriptional regulator [Actinomadura livida]|uniref:RNA polymerase-binding protein DksA n=1 Tax=Actinomadura livida TaxID=79909 RepID=A0A7W7IFU9_9ACTN|nr:RNA polymerase-binding protein DksA [Actinomadura catellatispora]GGU32526.1 DNA-binding protein [Actinomadura livida]